VPSSGRLRQSLYRGIVPTLGQLSVVVRRALCKAEHDNILALAKALAFTVFLSVPALALAAFGVVSLLSQPADVRRFFALHQLRVVPVAARHLAELSLVTVTTSSHGVLAILVGGTIAAWTLTTAMTTTMWALNAAAEVRGDALVPASPPDRGRDARGRLRRLRAVVGLARLGSGRLGMGGPQSWS
jgi:hypothetical protein